MSLPSLSSLPRATLVLGALFLVLATALLVIDRPVKAEQRIEKRLAEGKSVPTHFYVAPWLWRGLVVNTVLAGALLLGSGRIARPLQEKHEPLSGEGTRYGWGSRCLFGLVLVIAAFSGSSRLNHSLWGDEEWVMKRLIAPEVTQLPEGGVKLTPTPWTETLWFFSRGSNHIAQTVASRLVHDAFFVPGTGPRDPWFSEKLMRMPVLIAGLLSMLALAWAARVWGWTWGLAWVLIWYLQHPWFVRFGSDARGYGFVLLGFPLVIGCLGRAMQTGRWRWWLGLGLAEFFLFYSYFGTLYILLALNAALLLMLWREPSLGQDRAVFATRWLVAQVIAAMLVIGLMAPCLPQLLSFMKQKPLAGSMDLAWWQDALCYVGCGVPWHNWEPGNPLVVSLDQGGAGDWSNLLGMGMMALGFVMATCLMWRQSWQHRCLLVLFYGAPALMLLHTATMGVRPYHWYLVPYWPAMVLLMIVAVGPFNEARCLAMARRAQGLAMDDGAGSRSQEWTFFSLLVTPAIILTVGGAAERQNDRLLFNPIEANRESVALMREVTNPRHPDYGKEALSAGFVFYTEAYDPAMLKFQTADELRALIARADAEKRPLFINFSNRLFGEIYYPEVMKVIDDKAQFTRVKVLYGLFEASTREVYRHDPP